MVTLELIKSLIISALIIFSISFVLILLIYFFVSRLTNHKWSFRIKYCFVISWLLSYFYVVYFVTLNRAENTTLPNFNLFKTYIECWNNMSVHSVLQILLNIAMLIPLGFFLPLFFVYFRKFHRCVIASATVTLVIELIQLIFKKGFFDVDDIFNNTLGAILGWCVTMFLLSLLNKNRSFLIYTKYAVVPIAFVLSIIIVLSAYYFKDLGNLPVEYSIKYRTDNLQFELNCNLSETKNHVNIYKANSYSINKCDEWAKALYNSLGYSFDDVNTYYYRNENWYRNKNIYVTFNLRDGSFSYSETGRDRYDQEKIATAPISPDGSLAITDDMLLIPFAEVEKEVLIHKLNDLFINVPEEAAFIQEGVGKYTFVADKVEYNGGMYHGILYCEYYSDNTIKYIDNTLVDYEYYKSCEIISEKEAYDRLLSGHFNPPVILSETSLVEVASITLDYSLDTKGFLQPIYKFSVFVDGNPEIIIITAI